MAPIGLPVACIFAYLNPYITHSLYWRSRSLAGSFSCAKPAPSRLAVAICYEGIDPCSDANKTPSSFTDFLIPKRYS
jgi:hypothetical protein